jgi:ABC-type dipeptide/oligopeptide/nickel transport system permease subunit
MSAVAGVVAGRARARSRARLAIVRRLVRDRITLVAGLFLILVLGVALLGPSLYPVDPLKQDLNSTFAPPLGHHLLGSDSLGRDLFARILAGASVTLTAIAIAVGVSLAVGLIPALVSGYLGGRTDVAITRITDTLISFPPLILAIAIVGATGPGLRNAMIAVGVITSPTMVRVVRSNVLSVREEAYVEAARLMGCSHAWILRKHIFPNVISTVIVMVNLLAAVSLLAEAGLSFIGLGVVPPAASWGSLLRDGAIYTGIAPWLITFPGIAITLTVLALNIFGDGLRRAWSTSTR